MNDWQQGLHGLMRDKPATVRSGFPACYCARADTTHLSLPGYQPLMTRFGPVDLLGTIGKRRSYEALLPHSVEMELGQELRVRVLDLETLIAVKEEVGGCAGRWTRAGDRRQHLHAQG